MVGEVGVKRVFLAVHLWAGAGLKVKGSVLVNCRG